MVGVHNYKRGLEPKNCPKMIFFKFHLSVDQNKNEVGDLEGSCQKF